MVKWRTFLFLLLSCILATGCSDVKIIDDLALINAVAYDKSDDKENPINVTITFPIITKDGKYDRKNLSANAKSSKSARDKLDRETDLQLESGQLRVALFGEDLAREGILKHIDTLSRDPSIGTRVMLGLGMDKASELLEIEVDSEGQNATYLERYLQRIHQTSTDIIYDIFHFNRDYYDEGIDPILPVFNTTKKDIKFDGIGLFQDDKLIDLLSSDESGMLFFLKEKIDHGSLDMEVDDEGEESAVIMLSYVQTTHKVKATYSSPDSLSATIYIKMKGNVQEYTGMQDLADPKVQMKIEKDLRTQIEEKSRELIKTLQDLQVDSIGVGRYVKNKMSYNDWKALDWHEEFSKMDINVDIDVKLNNIGKWK
ncbi:spore germination protein [Bacillus mesophilus]|uniref:Ger(X)C family spore germination protein n=1 Tax=Bacillus mesophilus TaxID=1808955 RepID=A0A6M0QB29_9BACI|nr:Ger(x)C family spore germination protein [Bacillus mesophilus]MBM7662867.1 spore germination protein [Bacillus mesophilus]NEY73457.1 Ger(x)C family spore germination protein [Bacillus mesophilus]